MTESATRLRPPAFPGRLTRPRLLAVLQQRFEAPVTVVAAGPGFGKTSLLAQALAENRLASRGQDVWLSCQPGDAAASRLAACLFAALHLDVTSPEGPEEAAAVVAAELWRRSPTHVALVLDDVHVITRNSPAAQLLGSLLTGLPGNAHLVLAGRPPLPLPTARLAASGQLIELGEVDLLFDESELCAFAAERAVPFAAVADSGGWPALAELAAAAGQTRVVDYLWEELLDRLTPQEQRLLAMLIAVGGADAQLMSELAGGSVDLSGLVRGLPLALGEPGEWRALHPLWEPALAGRLGAEETAAVRRRVGVALARRGAVEDAFRLFCAAQACVEARSLVRQACASTHPVVAPDVLAQWYELLPAEQRREPEGRLLLGLVRKGHDVRSAEALLRESSTAFHAAGQGDGEIVCVAHLLHIACWRMDREALVTLTARGEQIAAAGQTSPRGVPMLGHALLAHVDGRTTDTLEHLDRIDVDSHPGLPAAVEFLRALELLNLGLPQQATGPARRLRALGGGGTFRSSALVVEMVARWLDGEVDEALALMPELTEASVALATGRAHNQVVESGAAALLAALAGDIDCARQQLRRGQQAMPFVTGLPHAAAALAIAETALFVTEGNEGTAGELARHLAVLPHTGHLAPWRSFRLVLSYVLVPESRNDWDSADLGPSLLIARTLAQAVVAVRDGRPVPDLSGVQPSAVRVHLPLPWAAELAAALLVARRADGARLLSALGPRVRPALRVLARGSTGLTAAARRALAELPPHPEEPIEVRVLGPLTLHRSGQLVTHPDLRRERVRLLLLYLIAHPTSTRADVAAELWPDLPDSAADRNLRVTLTYLQRVLEPGRSDHDSPYFVRSEGPWLHLTIGDQLTVDAITFDHEVQQGAHADRRRVPSQALAAFQRAVALYHGDYLADAGAAEWALFERDRLRLAYTTTAVRAGELLLGQGANEQALTLGRRALHSDRWSEAAYRLLAAAHGATGDRNAARRVLCDCRQMLRDLGVEPTPETLQLERLLTHPASRS